MTPLRSPWRNLSLRAKSLVVILFPLLTLIVAVFLVISSIRFSTDAEDNVQRSIRAVGNIYAVHAQVAEAASAVRGFLYTRDKAFLRPYWRAKRQIPDALIAMQNSVTDPVQVELIAEIARLVRLKMDSLDRTRLEAERNPDLKLQQTLVNEKVLLDVLREKIAQTDLRGQELIRRYTETANQSRQRHLIIALSAATLGIFTAIGFSWWFANGLVTRVRDIGENAKRLESGQTQYLLEPSNDELGQLAVRIQKAGNMLAARAVEAQTARLDAEIANRAKTDFLSRISHELRTPLNAILGFAQLLERDLRGTPKQRSVELILSGGHHLLQLVNDVLDISRIESGNLVMRLTPFDLNSIILETIAMTNSQSQLNRVTVSFDPAATAPSVFVMADRHRLIQVLLNLISNAIKYNRVEGRVDISIEAIATTHWRVAIADTGIGISAALEQKLFSPFARAEETRIEGTGLGLAVSKSLIEAMQGELGWSRRPDEGSIFWLTLGRVDPQDTSEQTGVLHE